MDQRPAVDSSRASRSKRPRCGISSSKLSDPILGALEKGSEPEPEPPPSPESSYDNRFEFEDGSGKEEPVPLIPQMLGITVLNGPSDAGGPASAAEPTTGSLGHLFLRKDPHMENVLALASTDRLGKKFVTTVIYKPMPGIHKPAGE